MNTNLYIRTIAIITGFIAAFAGCGKGICMQGSGVVTTEARTATGIKEIHLYNRVNLALTQDSTESIQVEAGQHLLGGIETSMQNGILTIKDNNTCNWVRDLDNRVNVYVHANRLQKLIYYGSGNVSTTNTIVSEKLNIESREGTGSLKLSIQNDECHVVITKNNADITLDGSSAYIDVHCADQGKINMMDLVSQVVWVDHRSIYDVHLQVGQQLVTNIWYKGNIYYKGDPFYINNKTYSTGRLIQLP